MTKASLRLLSREQAYLLGHRLLLHCKSYVRA